MSTTTVLIKKDGSVVISETGHSEDPEMVTCLGNTAQLLEILARAGISAELVGRPERAGDVAEEVVEHVNGRQRQ